MSTASMLSETNLWSRRRSHTDTLSKPEEGFAEPSPGVTPEKGGASSRVTHPRGGGVTPPLAGLRRGLAASLAALSAAAAGRVIDVPAGAAGGPSEPDQSTIDAYILQELLSDSRVGASLSSVVTAGEDLVGVAGAHVVQVALFRREFR